MRSQDGFTVGGIGEPGEAGADAVETTGPTASAPAFAWLSDAPDGEAVLGPHLHPDTPAYSNSS